MKMQNKIDNSNEPKHWDTETLKRENDAYNALAAAGYRLQGEDLKSNLVVVMKIENENTNEERRKIWYFKNWETAAAQLLKQGGKENA